MTPLIGLVLLSTSPAAPANAIEPALSEPAPLVTALVEDPPVMHRWTGAVSMGATISDGNTEKATASATGDAEYRREKDRTSFNLLWSFAEDTTGDDPVGVTERRLYGMGKYDYFFSKKTYGYGSLSGEYNYAAQLDLRATVSTGLGYQFLEEEDRKLSGEAGLAYVDESYFDSDDDAEYLAARLAYKGFLRFNEKLEAQQTGEVFPSLEDGDDVSTKLDTRLRATLTETMFAQVQHLWTWDNTPASGAERSDHLLILTLGWKF
jgi:putative salt-induced outer membrane protein YdiY